jgi:hypothetical protein
MTLQQKLEAAFHAAGGQVYLDVLSNALRECGFQGQLRTGRDFLTLDDRQAEKALRIFTKYVWSSVPISLVLSTMR